MRMKMFPPPQRRCGTCRMAAPQRAGTLTRAGRVNLSTGSGRSRARSRLDEWTPVQNSPSRAHGSVTEIFFNRPLEPSSRHCRRSTVDHPIQQETHHDSFDFSHCAVLGLMSTAAFAQTAAPAPKHSAKATVGKSTPKPIPSTPRQKLASEAKSLAFVAARMGAQMRTCSV